MKRPSNLILFCFRSKSQISSLVDDDGDYKGDDGDDNYDDDTDQDHEWL